jgi:hypothetical protein
LGISAWLLDGLEVNLGRAIISGPWRLAQGSLWGIFLLLMEASKIPSRVQEARAAPLRSACSSSLDSLVLNIGLALAA